MRTDATIDGRQVRVPNASTLGFGRWQARVHDYVTYKYPGSESVRTGRMIGRIAYAPPCGESPATRNWLLVLELSTDYGAHAYERWINPEWVSYCERPERHALAFYAWYTQPKLPKYSIVRGLAEYGTLSASYADKIEERTTELSARGYFTQFE